MKKYFCRVFLMGRIKLEEGEREFFFVEKKMYYENCGEINKIRKFFFEESELGIEIYLFFFYY